MCKEGLVSIRVVTSLPPTLNQSYKIVYYQGSSRLALSEEALAYKDEIAILAFQALTKEFPVINGPGGGEYMLEIVQWLPKNSRDVDANVKLVMDGICRGVGLNDNRVFDVGLRKRITRIKTGKKVDPMLREGRLEATLWYMGQGIVEGE